jgi:membrane-bound serine protease (ClpP class)
MDNLTLAYVLIALGALLLLAELFVPTGGILLLGAGACIAVGVVLSFVYGEPRTGMLTLVLVTVSLPIFGTLLFYLWPKTPLGRKLVMPPEDATVAQMPVIVELEALRGRTGRTVSTMRPSGVVDFDGRRVDCVTEGMMLDSNQWVKCIDVRAGRVVVRQIEAPTLRDLENTDFS